MVRSLVLVAAVVCGCGRIGYDDLVDGAAIDAPSDGPAAPVCPSGTSALRPGSRVCVEQLERGYLPWDAALAACTGVGRRLCTDAEWLEACENASGLVDMTN